MSVINSGNMIKNVNSKEIEYTLNIKKSVKKQIPQKTTELKHKKYWIVKHNNTEYIIFEDSKKHKIIIDNTDENMSIISNDTFYLNEKIGYCIGANRKQYIHRILMKDVEQPSEKHKYVDHINRVKSDNRLCNLRWVTQSENNMNTDKRRRKTSARELPDEIKDVILPKYVVYYYDKTTEQHFFTIEKHPALGNKRPKTTKSKKVDLLSKLEEAKGMLKELDSQMPDDIKNLDKLRQERLEEYDEIMKLIPNEHDAL